MVTTGKWNTFGISVPRTRRGMKAANDENPPSPGFATGRE